MAVSMSKLVQGGAAPILIADAVLAGTSMNMIAKMAIGAFIARGRFAVMLTAITVLPMACGLVALLLLRRGISLRRATYAASVRVL